jgi:histone deacetylase complex regulatory component SIN3
VRSSAARALGRIGNDTAQNMADDTDIEASQSIAIFTSKIQQLLTQFEQHQPQTPEIYQSVAQILQQQPDLKQKFHQLLTPSSIQLLKALIQHPLGQTMLDVICQEVAD